MNTAQTVERIRTFIASDACKSRNWLAEKAGVSEYALREVFTEKWNPTLQTLLKLEAAIVDCLGHQALQQSLRASARGK